MELVKQAVALLLAAVVITGAGCGGADRADGTDSVGGGPAPGSPPEWPAPADPLERTLAAGFEPARREHLETHRHAHHDVFFNGTAVTVPAAIGIDTTDPGVKYFDEPSGPSYGGIEECVNPCISPLHTHDETGVLHTESASDDISTLGQFFLEWGVRLDEACVGDYCAPETDVAVYVAGERVGGDPAAIRLTDGTEIAVVIGSPPEHIPDDADFSTA